MGGFKPNKLEINASFGGQTFLCNKLHTRAKFQYYNKYTSRVQRNPNLLFTKFVDALLMS